MSEPLKAPWYSLIRYAVEVLVGTGIFLLIAVSALVVRFIFNFIESSLLGLGASNDFLILFMRIAEKTIFALDLVLFLIFLFRVSPPDTF